MLFEVLVPGLWVWVLCSGGSCYVLGVGAGVVYAGVRSCVGAWMCDLLLQQIQGKKKKKKMSSCESSAEHKAGLGRRCARLRVWQGVMRWHEAGQSEFVGAEEHYICLMFKKCGSVIKRGS